MYLIAEPVILWEKGKKTLNTFDNALRKFVWDVNEQKYLTCAIYYSNVQKTHKCTCYVEYLVHIIH